MFFVKYAGRTIKLISLGIFYKFNKSFGGFHHAERYIQIIIFIKLIRGLVFVCPFLG